MRRCGRRGGGLTSPLGPMGISPEAFDSLFEAIEPADDGRKRYRFRLLPEGPVLEACPPAQPIAMGLIVHKPMEAPVGLVFYLDYAYGKK